MIPYDRRRLCLVTLGALAIFVGGTALAERRTLLPTARVSAARLNEKARRILAKRVSQSPSQVVVTPESPLLQATEDDKPARRQFTVYRNPEGETVCREATAAEIAQREQADPEGLGLRQINHLEIPDDKSSTSQSPAATNLTIVLRATQQLQQNQAATAAFTRAAQNWESLIMSPVTIYIDVDYGTTNFGQAWPNGVLGSTSAPGSSYPYQSVRANLIAEATGEGNATKQAIFNALPSTTVPTDLGDASATDVSDSTARAIGLLPATAQPTDTAARIAFNSNFTFDFDPSDGITASAIDFDAVATHEIGHALGFDS
ncbi:MAG TPA: NF038122 family metalloprotease, partial [Pyrinomonadaceae bacterium]|nr:NF038122 family metalloprotease [Pyrinomonadaceae bacterium]